MRIAMIGAGYVGLVSSACFSEFGVDVICIDKDENKIARLQKGDVPIFEPGLDTLIANNRRARRLSFGTNTEAAVSEADAVFIAVGTPSRRGDAHADLTYVYEAAHEISQYLKEYTVIVTKSTVPVGTGRLVESIIRKQVPYADFDIASNPEFLREGSAINDFMRPDRVIVGTDSQRARDILTALYRPLFLIETPVLFTNLETAEITKYACNSFLATKITFINEIADLCECVGADVHDVAKGIGLDGRIGQKFLHPGPGYGGSCFPKDTAAFIRSAREFGVSLSIIETTVRINDDRKKHMIDKIIAACGGSIKGKTIAILGLTYKPNTDDMREAPSLVIVPGLQSKGATIKAFDPIGMEEAKVLLPNVGWCSDPFQAMESADAVVILTEWNEFRALDLLRAKKLLRTPLMIDLRNIYDPTDLAAAGFRYECIGRGVPHPVGDKY